MTLLAKVVQTLGESFTSEVLDSLLGVERRGREVSDHVRVSGDPGVPAARHGGVLDAVEAVDGIPSNPLRLALLAGCNFSSTFPFSCIGSNRIEASQP